MQVNIDRCLLSLLQSHLQGKWLKCTETMSRFHVMAWQVFVLLKERVKCCKKALCWVWTISEFTHSTSNVRISIIPNYRKLWVFIDLANCEMFVMPSTCICEILYVVDLISNQNYVVSQWSQVYKTKTWELTYHVAIILKYFDPNISCRYHTEVFRSKHIM